MLLRVKKLVPTALLPSSSHPGDAGLDLYAVERTVLRPGQSRDIRHGIAIEPPEGHWSRIVGRSSAHRRLKLRVLEGIIDHGYRGELYTYVTNESDQDVVIDVGDRISQLIIHPLVELAGVLEAALTESARGTDGFGSTGGGKWLEAAPVLAYTNVTAEDWVMANHRTTIYVGGPIDYVSGHADRRHTDVNRLLPDAAVYCPGCAQIANPFPSTQAIERNMLQLDRCDWAVFVWNRDQVTVGTPIEVWHRVVKGAAPRTIIVMESSPVEPGLLERFFKEAGVRYVRSIQGATEIIRRERYGSGPAVDIEASTPWNGGSDSRDGDGGAGGGDVGEHQAPTGAGSAPPTASGRDLHSVRAPWETRQAADGPDV